MIAHPVERSQACESAQATQKTTTMQRAKSTDVHQPADFRTTFQILHSSPCIGGTSSQISRPSAYTLPVQKFSSLLERASRICAWFSIWHLELVAVDQGVAAPPLQEARDKAVCLADGGRLLPQLGVPLPQHVRHLVVHLPGTTRSNKKLGINGEGGGNSCQEQLAGDRA
jgi:hypothetical protein